MNKCEVCGSVCAVQYANTKFGMTGLCMKHYRMARETDELTRVGEVGEKRIQDYVEERLKNG